MVEQSLGLERSRYVTPAVRCVSAQVACGAVLAGLFVVALFWSHSFLLLVVLFWLVLGAGWSPRALVGLWRGCLGGTLPRLRLGFSVWAAIPIAFFFFGGAALACLFSPCPAPARAFLAGVFCLLLFQMTIV
jgi:hypothetical protein